ncbi:hypothetical protein KQH60_13890 [Mycetohabitans sp. B8]|nr:hypothetical protein [Mycetohabitans sp. B8]MCG1043559.1 hypothetical protein [Mycetohabitans sp. B8]
MFEHLPGEPLITRDNLDTMSVESVAHVGIAPELGILERASVQSVALLYLTEATRQVRSSAKRMSARR